jgi:peptide/nickel transport system substrate-binding protein
MSMKNAQLLKSAAVLLGVSLAVTACAGAAPETVSNAGAVVSDDTLTWGTATEPVCFDPHQNSQNNAFAISRNFAESLVATDEDGEFHPWLASSWEISPDGLSYTFELRDDVTFSDGTPLDAEAVKANLDWVTDPANKPGFAGLQVQYVDSTTVVDEHTVQIALSQADSSLLGSLSGVSLGILSPASLIEDATALCAGGPALIGTGPFTFADYTRGQSATFERYDDYDWAPETKEHEGRAYLKEVVYRFLPESSVRTGSLTSNQVDVIDSISALDKQQIDAQDTLEYLTAEHAGTAFSLNVNYTTAPLDDIRVRKALQSGFEAETLVDSIYFDTVEPAWSQIASASSFYDPETEGSWGNDVDEANELLDEAGWTGRNADDVRTKDGVALTVTAVYPQPYVRDNRDQLVQAVAAEVKKNTGIDLQLKIVPIGEFTDSVAAKQWGLYPNSQAQADPGQSLFTLLDGQGNFLFKDPAATDQKLHADLVAAVGEVDPAKRLSDYAAIQEYILEQAYVIPLFVPTYQLGSAGTVHGLAFQPQAGVPDGAYDAWKE